MAEKILNYFCQSGFLCNQIFFGNFALMKKDRIFSFILAMLMLTAAAITVNKAVFGHDIQRTESPGNTSSDAVGDTITVGADGSVIIHTAGLPGTISGYGGPVPSISI